MKRSARLSPGRRWARAGICLAAVVLAVAVLIYAFGGVILNGYGKRKAESAFARAHPGSVLRIGKLDYSLGANRLIAQSATLSATNSRIRVGRVSLMGVRWARLLWRSAALADVFARASCDATNFEMDFTRSNYQLRCARVSASVLSSKLIAEATELRTLVGDEEFFATHQFRTTRFRLTVPECSVSGVGFNELLEGKSYRAKLVCLSGPSFEALVNRDKPGEPFVSRPLMVHEALAAILQPLEVDCLTITNGTLRYCERLTAGADPGVLTFGSVSLSVNGIANRGDATAAVQIRAQGDLMNAGTMKVLMSIPITGSNFSLHYSGSLTAMDLTRLDAFLTVAEHLRIKSGTADEAAFEIEVTAGQARGHVRANYRDLEIALLDKQTGSEKGAVNRVSSLFVNLLKVRNTNKPAGAGLRKEGEVNYSRRPEDEFMQFAWFALRTGVMDVISR
jgi:hypothetical protein